MCVCGHWWLLPQHFLNYTLFIQTLLAVLYCICIVHLGTSFKDFYLKTCINSYMCFYNSYFIYVNGTEMVQVTLLRRTLASSP